MPPTAADDRPEPYEASVTRTGRCDEPPPNVPHTDVERPSTDGVSGCETHPMTGLLPALDRSAATFRGHPHDEKALVQASRRTEAPGPIPGTAWPDGDNGGMAFGQQAGPPASRREVEKLLKLLQDAGHTDFRDARGPMAFTQRQAAGKFTRDEAAAFIAQLEETEASGEPVAPPPSNARLSAAEQALRRMPAELLAAELQRRGWVVVQP